MLTPIIDPIPLVVILAIFAIVSLLVYELGFRGGRWWQDKTPEETEGPTGMLVGSILALMAFLLAVTMGMASDRFDARRGLVMQEANAIGTTYLRAGYLDEPASSEIRTLLREYVPNRISSDDPARVAAGIARSEELHAELWVLAEEVAQTTDRGDVTALFIESLNEVIDVHAMRVTAGIYARVPETVLAVLVLGSILSIGMVGYNAGLTGRRSLISAAVLIVALGVVLVLVVDLDRPQNGFITVSQRPLQALEQQLGPP
jgi:hypothetical protein